MNKDMSLIEISTFLNKYAAECGGEHHKPEQIEMTLRMVSGILFDKALEVRETVDRLNDTVMKKTGIDEGSLFIIRRNKNIRYFEESE